MFSVKLSFLLLKKELQRGKDSDANRSAREEEKGKTEEDVV